MTETKMCPIQSRNSEAFYNEVSYGRPVVLNLDSEAAETTMKALAAHNEALDFLVIVEHGIRQRSDEGDLVRNVCAAIKARYPDLPYKEKL